MAKRPISITMEVDNITWLRARARALGTRGVSALVDRLVAEARIAAPGLAPRSVVGTIDLDAGDPLLETADQAMRAMVGASVSRPAVVRERAAAYTAGRKRGRRG